DEFTVLLEDVIDPRIAEETAARIAGRLSSPIGLGGRDVFTTASIGIALSDGDYEDPDDLLRDADTAMYRSKGTGKARATLFDRTMVTEVLQRLELETALRGALESGGLHLHYQPIVDLKTGAMKEVEALVRWDHPDRGLIAPAAFVPLAEETGIVVPL